MPKSRLRGGAKAHRKRVQARNQKLRGMQNQMQRLWQEEMEKQFEAIRAQQESETVELDVKTPKLPTDNENTPLEIKL
jgi:chaperone required for assembly of F1-ATPase